MTVLLLVSSVGEASFENQEMFGRCSLVPNTIFIRIDPVRQELVLTRQFDVFRIPLPAEEGTYDLVYYFGEEFAELEPGGKLLVMRGPRGYW